MKCILGFLMLVSAPIASASQVPTKDVIVSVNGVFVPGGFSSESDAYVVLNGMFPNTCYSWDRAEVKNTTTKQHEIAAIAKVTQGTCLMMLVPWTKDVRLGKLERGHHMLRIHTGNGNYFERALEIE